MKAQSARYECADGGSDQQQKRCDGKRLDCGAGTGHVRLLLGLGGLTRLIWLVWLFWLGDGFDGYRHLSAYASWSEVRNCGPAPPLAFASITSSTPLRTAVMVMFWLTASKAFLFPTACIARSI